MLKKGNVIRFYAKNIINPHPKYLVILAADKHMASYATVLINSTPNLNINNTPELLALQYPITKTNNPFLHHDSTVDCAQVKLYLCEEIHPAVKAKPEVVLGDLFAQDMAVICSLIHSAETTAPHIIKNFKF